MKGMITHQWLRGHRRHRQRRSGGKRNPVPWRRGRIERSIRHRRGVAVFSGDHNPRGYQRCLQGSRRSATQQRGGRREIRVTTDLGRRWLSQVQQNTSTDDNSHKCSGTQQLMVEARVLKRRCGVKQAL